MPDARRRLPSLDALLRSAPGRRASERFGREVLKHELRRTLNELRGARASADPEAILARAANQAARSTLGISAVINATGVVLHTNLGRAPLPAEAVSAVRKVAGAYADLEVDRETGQRGRRTSHAEQVLCALTGAEDALVVNNNAAALLLALAALARRKEVPVSRGELIEIGGEFRLPEIIAASGAKLVEVGTTNRTRLSDYRAAVSERTGLLLKVHPSNYRVVGFSESPGVGALASLAHRSGIPLVHDIGSGLLAPVRGVPAEEPTATGSLEAGAGLVCFSGDKLLGGPQAGIVLGHAGLIERLRRNPIARAVRVDKLTVAALEAVLRLHAAGRRELLPAWRAIKAPTAQIKRRAASVALGIEGAVTARSEAVAGGGSLPGWAISSHAVRLPSDDPEALAARLRLGNPPVFCRLDEDAVVFDLLTVDPADDERLSRAVGYALAQDA